VGQATRLPRSARPPARQLVRRSFSARPPQ